MNIKNAFSKSKKVKLIIIFILSLVAVTFIILIYNQHQNDKKEQAVIVQQKEEDIKVENQKQEGLAKQVEQKKLEQEKLDQEKDEIEQKKIEEQKNLVEQKKIEEQKKVDEEKVKEETSSDSAIVGNTTKEEAIKIVSNIIINKTPKVKVEYDHNQKREGKDYYVVRAYDDMGDHISTLGWYYVQIDTGKAFEWDLIEDTLIPIN